MNKKPDSLTYLLGIIALIIVGIVTTSLINAVKNTKTTPTDIRARAGVVNIVRLTGTVSDTNSTDGTVTVDSVQLAPESRSGPAVNYGTWTVTPPQSVNFSSLAPGQRVSFVINSASFDVATHQVIASELTIVK